MNRAASIICAGLAIAGVLLTFVGPASTQETDDTTRLNHWLQEWAFLMGDWHLTENRYDFESKLIETNEGRARFRRVMEGQRYEETQELTRKDGSKSDALHVFAYDPLSEEVEIARTDSGHYGFWVIIGKATKNGLELVAKHPDPEEKITRRIRYTRYNDRNFKRTLEFSEDNGETYFVRSEWIYTRE